jgi:hypothetical protein
MDDAIPPFHPRRLTIVSAVIIAGAVVGSVILAWPLPRSPAPSLVRADPVISLAPTDAYAAALAASPRAAMFDPDGHAQLIEERERVARPDRPIDAMTAFHLLDTARRHADATVFPRWTAIFSFVLCLGGGVMGLWRARRAAHTDTDPGAAVNREAVGLSAAAALVSAFLVGWTSKLTSTIVTLFTTGTCAGLMIGGRVLPPSLVGAHVRPGRPARIALGAGLAVAGVLGRRALAPAADAGGVEIVVRSLPMLLCSSVMLFGVLLATSNIAYLLMRRPVS